MAARSSGPGKRRSARRPAHRLSPGAETARRSSPRAALPALLTPACRLWFGRSRSRDLLELREVVQVVPGQHLHDEADRLRPALPVDVGPCEVLRRERADEREVPRPQRYEGPE